MAAKGPVVIRWSVRNGGTWVGEQQSVTMCDSMKRRKNNFSSLPIAGMAIVWKIFFCALMEYLVQTRLIPPRDVDLSFAATGKSKLERFINVRKQSFLTQFPMLLPCPMDKGPSAHWDTSPTSLMISIGRANISTFPILLIILCKLKLF